MSVFHIQMHDPLQETFSNFSNSKARDTQSPHFIYWILDFSHKEFYYVCFSYEVLIFLYQFAAQVRRNLLLLSDKAQV